jgi:hypothetical protein
LKTTASKSNPTTSGNDGSGAPIFARFLWILATCGMLLFPKLWKLFGK